MNADENEEKEFIIPTRYKSKIGSHQSWPIGAMELTNCLLNVPQLKDLQITFSGGGSKIQKGKEPIIIPVIAARFSHDRKLSAIFKKMNFSKWTLTVYSVPRIERAEIRMALKQNGLILLADWFAKYSSFASNEGNWNYTAFWNSRLKDLSLSSLDYVLPEIANG